MSTAVVPEICVHEFAQEYIAEVFLTFGGINI